MSGALSRTETAIQRLGVVIDRLEAAATRASAGDLLLAGELREAHDQHAVLQDTTRAVGQRLDGAIVRLRSLLEA